MNIWIDTTKGGRDRIVPLNEKAIEAFLEMKKKTHKDVFTTINTYTHIIKGLEDEEELKICV